jgi:SAM-dependent MidA family methyltransferase
MTVAAFMELALYHPEHGYYTSRAQRSGRRGDFYTSVDAGAFFGELLAVQIAEMACALDGAFDLVEAAAGNGRLMRDVLDALQRDAPDVYARVRVHLVDRSAAARGAQAGILGPHAATSSAALPAAIDGVVFANELLDALPVHVVVMRGADPREIVVGEKDGSLVELEAPVSNERVRREIDAGPLIPDGVRVEVGLAATDWMREVSMRVKRGYLLLLDYGDDARALRSAARPDGTLRAFSAHRVSGRWLESPGAQDLTAHVDFSACARAAADGGMDLLGRVDQSRFLLRLGALERLARAEATLPPRAALRLRLAVKTLLVPGGMGSTHHAMVFRERGQTPLLRFPQA